jgi:protein-L-isoaspartate(D-aspartate) O-methyltransferase
VGENLAIAPNRVILDPRTLAKMLDLLDLRPGEAVLDIGCGLGYSSAVAARMAAAVVGVEEIAALAEEAETTLAREGVDNATVVCAPLAEGAARHGPYDVIIIQGGVEQVPEAVIAQLRPGGRIVAPFMRGALGVVRIGHKPAGGGVLSWRDAFHGAAPVLPGYARDREFSL